MYKTIVFFFFLKFLFFISIDVFIHIYHKCQNFKYFVFLLKDCRYYLNTTHTSSDVSTISMACRKQRHQSESREHVHRRIIAYLLAHVHLAPCTHIKHSHTNTVSVCVWVRTITLLSRPTHSTHPMGITSIEITRISMHRSNILDLELRWQFKSAFEIFLSNSLNKIHLRSRLLGQVSWPFEI